MGGVSGRQNPAWCFRKADTVLRKPNNPFLEAGAWAGPAPEVGGQQTWLLGHERQLGSLATSSARGCLPTSAYSDLNPSG
jgi:hypothetical protein